MAVDDHGRGREPVYRRTQPTPEQPLTDEDEPLLRLEAVVKKRSQKYG